MNRMFYLSLVFDINGYDRLDLVKNPSLKKLDEIVSNYHDANEVIEAYLSEYNINKKGRVCMIFEDLDEKKKQLDHYNGANEEDKERIKADFSYVHVIPVMYKGRKLLNFASCLPLLRNRLHNIKTQVAILYDIVEQNGEKKKFNKKYIFNDEQEIDLIDNEADFHGAVNHLLDRLKNEPADEQYFVCRTLMNICKLTVNEFKTRFGKLVVYEDAKERRNKKLTKTEILEEETKNMDDFYTYHDLDEVIKYSPDENRPIGSERRNRI